MTGWVWVRTAPERRLVSDGIGDPVRSEPIAPLSELETRLLAAAPGDVVAAVDAPPWIVVDDELAGVSVSWPGRLLDVEALPALAPRDREREAETNAQHRGRYRRVTRVRVLREASPSALFGARGDRVIDVIGRASTLTTAEASVLADHLPPAVEDACARVWRRWSGAERRVGSAVLLDPNIRGGSPINRGLLVINDVVNHAAAGHAAARYVWDDEDPDDEDTWLELDVPWRHASTALRCAALALGAADVSDDEGDVLLASWRALTRPPAVP